MFRNKIYLYIAIPILAVALLYAGRLLLGSRPAHQQLSRPHSLGLAKEVILASQEKSVKSAPDSADKKPFIYPNLKLEGTIISDRPSAYIRDLDSKTSSFYNIGDRVSSAALLDIKRGEVLLEIEGTRYSLYLQTGSSYNSPIEELSPAFRIVTKAGILDIINTGENKLNTLAQVRPYKDKEGSFSGYMIDGIKWGGLAYLTGLRNGDIIKELNKQKLLSQQKAMQTFKKVRRLNNIDIGLLRDSKWLNLRYKIK